MMQFLQSAETTPNKMSHSNKNSKCLAIKILDFVLECIKNKFELF